MTEDQLEMEALGWLADVGYDVHNGLDIAPDGSNPQRADYRQVSLCCNLRKNITVDWSRRESVRASLRLMVKRILRKYKYPPDLEAAAVELVLQQAEALGESWIRV